MVDALGRRDTTGRSPGARSGLTGTGYGHHLPVVDSSALRGAVLGLGEDAETYYRKAKDAIIAAKGNYRETKNAFLRMRQISSGFVGFHDENFRRNGSCVKALSLSLVMYVG